MKKLLFIVLAICILIGGPVWAAKDELRIYIWTDYMDEPMMAAKFKEKFGIKVRFEGFESIEEMMAKLQSGGVSQYDIVCLGDYNYQTAIKMNLIQPLDHSKIPNLKNVMPHFRKSYFVYTDNRAVEVLKCGQTHDMVRFDADPDKFIKPPPPGFDIDEYMIRPVNEEIIKLLNHGDIIDLGNRKLEVLHTPGHTNDSIMLLDRKNRPLFTGDTYYPDLLFAFFRDEWGNSDLQVYQKTIKDLTKLAPNLDYLYPCHLEPLAAPHILYDVAKAFEAVNRGEVEYKIEQLYFNPVRVYDFEGFSIGTLDE